MRLPAIAFLLALAAPISSCGEGGGDDAAPVAASGRGETFVMKVSQVPRWTAVSAEVATVDQAQATARIPGILTTLSVHEGDYVKKGQAIGRIVDSQLGYQASAYGAQAAAAQAQVAQAKAELARTRYLYENGVYAKARLEQAEAASASAQAQVRAALAQQGAVSAVAGQGAVIAPASGRVLAADIPAGSAVAPGAVIATITSGPVVLKLEIPDTLATQLHPGSAVRFTDEGGTVRAGTIGRVYPAVAGGQVRADADIPGLDAGLIGRRVAAEVDAGTKAALLVPHAYVTTRYGIDYVTLQAEGSQPATVPVQTAPSSEPGMVEVLSGVSAGDVLIRRPGTAR